MDGGKKSEGKSCCSIRTCPSAKKVKSRTNIKDMNNQCAIIRLPLRSCCSIGTCPSVKKMRSKSNIRDTKNQCAFVGSPLIDSLNIDCLNPSKTTSVDCVCSPNRKPSPLPEKCIKCQMQNLLERQRNYDGIYRTFKSVADKKGCCCSAAAEKNYAQGDVKRITDELKLENQILKSELMEMKFELKHCLEKIEGPMKQKLQTEKSKYAQLQQELTRTSENMAACQDCCMKEMNALKMQLCAACSNITDLNNINDRLKEEMKSLDCMCSKLEDDLLKQKLNEADTIRLLTKRNSKLDGGDNIPTPCPPDCSQKAKESPSITSRCDSNLHIIARKLSKTLKESAPCEECSKLPALTGAAKLIKDLTDLVESRKIDRSSLDSMASSKECSCQSPPQTEDESCQCDNLRDIGTGQSTVRFDMGPSESAKMAGDLPKQTETLFSAPSTFVDGNESSQFGMKTSPPPAAPVDDAESLYYDAPVCDSIEKAPKGVMKQSDKVATAFGTPTGDHAQILKMVTKDPAVRPCPRVCDDTAPCAPIGKPCVTSKSYQGPETVSKLTKEPFFASSTKLDELPLQAIEPFAVKVTVDDKQVKVESMPAELIEQLKREASAEGVAKYIASIIFRGVPMHVEDIPVLAQRTLEVPPAQKPKIREITSGEVVKYISDFMLKSISSTASGSIPDPLFISRDLGGTPEQAPGELDQAESAAVPQEPIVIIASKVHEVTSEETVHYITGILLRSIALADQKDEESEDAPREPPKSTKIAGLLGLEDQGEPKSKESPLEESPQPPETENSGLSGVEDQEKPAIKEVSFKESEDDSPEPPRTKIAGLLDMEDQEKGESKQLSPKESKHDSPGAQYTKIAGLLNMEDQEKPESKELSLKESEDGPTAGAGLLDKGDQEELLLKDSEDVPREPPQTDRAGLLGMDDQEEPEPEKLPLKEPKLSKTEVGLLLVLEDREEPALEELPSEGSEGVPSKLPQEELAEGIPPTVPMKPSEKFTFISGSQERVPLDESAKELPPPREEVIEKPMKQDVIEKSQEPAESEYLITAESLDVIKPSLESKAKSPVVSAVLKSKVGLGSPYQAFEENVGEFPFEVESTAVALDESPSGLHVTTTITTSGNLEIITEGPAGIIETSLIFTEAGTIEVVTQITELPPEDTPATEITTPATTGVSGKKQTRSSKSSPEAVAEFDEAKQKMISIAKKKDSILSGASDLTGLETVSDFTKDATPESSATDEIKALAPPTASLENDAAAQQTYQIPTHTKSVGDKQESEASTSTEEKQRKEIETAIPSMTGDAAISSHVVVAEKSTAEAPEKRNSKTSPPKGKDGSCPTTDERYRNRGKVDWRGYGSI
ncbi:hypothetical protein JTB14_032751 [Gonioctena quinquepunctata]|nr:hypothetical protein JTB14_032751 [Gonioctena quinquepunctata]